MGDSYFLGPFHIGNMQISSFRKKISSVNSQLSNEIIFEIAFQFRTCSILRNFAEEISLMERCDWSVGQRLQTSCVYDVGFQKFISNVKVLTFERKNSKFLFRNKILK